MIIKQELSGIITLGMTVKEADGILDKDTKVKISDDMEVEEVDTAQDHVFGLILVANREAGGKATITTRGKRVSDETTGAAYSAGEFLSVDATGRVMRAASARATGTVTISDYSAVEAGDTVTVNGVALTAGGTDWTAATSNQATALSLAQAINARVPGVKATANSGVVTIEALTPGVAGNSITLATSMEVAEGAVSGAALTGGREFFPSGQALEESTAADQTKSVLWF